MHLIGKSWNWGINWWWVIICDLALLQSQSVSFIFEYPGPTIACTETTILKNRPRTLAVIPVWKKKLWLVKILCPHSWLHLYIYLATLSENNDWDIEEYNKKPIKNINSGSLYKIKKVSNESSVNFYYILIITDLHEYQDSTPICEAYNFISLTSAKWEGKSYCNFVQVPVWQFYYSQVHERVLFLFWN